MKTRSTDLLHSGTPVLGRVARVNDDSVVSQQEEVSVKARDCGGGVLRVEEKTDEA